MSIPDLEGVAGCAEVPGCVVVDDFDLMFEGGDYRYGGSFACDNFEDTI